MAEKVPPPEACLETFERTERVLVHVRKDEEMEHLSDNEYTGKIDPSLVHEHLLYVYDERVLEDWYSDDDASQACGRIMDRYPEGDLSKYTFFDDSMRYIRWYARKDVDSRHDLFFRFKHSCTYSKEQIVQYMRALAEDTNGVDWLFVDFVSWFAENCYDLHNQFHNGWLDDRKRQKRKHHKHS